MMDYLMQGIITLSETLSPSLSPSPLSGVSQPVAKQEPDILDYFIQKDVEAEADAKQAELDSMWEKIQDLKETDMLAAQVMYEKYRAKAGDIPPPIPSHIIEDQAVS